MSTFEIISLLCPSCGGSLDDEGTGEVKCKHCGTVSIIIPPAKSNLNNLNINEDWKKKLEHSLLIIEQFIYAGNFKEANEYCNKGLEIEPSLGSFWENKAICKYWLSRTENILNTGAREIFSYLDMSKKVEPDSATFKSTAEKIFSNLYNCLLSQLGKIYPEGAYIKVIEIMKFMELCYDKYPDINFKFIDYVIREYSDNHKIIWTEQWPKGTIKTYKNIRNLNINFNPAEKYKQLIEKVKKNYPDYNPPKIKLQKNYITTIAISIISILVVFILIYSREFRIVCEWIVAILVGIWLIFLGLTNQNK